MIHVAYQPCHGHELGAAEEGENETGVMNAFPLEHFTLLLLCLW